MTKIDSSPNERLGPTARRALEPSRPPASARSVAASSQVEIRSVPAAVSA